MLLRIRPDLLKVFKNVCKHTCKKFANLSNNEDHGCLCTDVKIVCTVHLICLPYGYAIWGVSTEVCKIQGENANYLAHTLQLTKLEGDFADTNCTY